MATTKAIKDLTTDDVKQVYSGRNGKCCCGCSGTHTANDGTPKALRQVKRILGIVQKAEEKDLDNDGSYVATVVGKRLYIAYLLDGVVAIR